MKTNETIVLDENEIVKTTLFKAESGWLIRRGNDFIPVSLTEAPTLAKLILEDQE